MVRITKKRRQINAGRPEQVFPLLCPVREKDWIFGWEYEMIYSVSGLAEKGCVFQTEAAGKRTTWYVSVYDPQNFRIEFVRMTPEEMVVCIRIVLSGAGDNQTSALISYEYSALSPAAEKWLEEEADKVFNENMDYWEKAINHYLITGTMLGRIPQEV